MKRIIFLLFCAICCFTLQAQDNTQITKILESLIANKVYEGDKTFWYEATKLNEDGEIISKEMIAMEIQSVMNEKVYENGRIYFIWKHNPSVEDSLRLYPIAFAASNREWRRNDTTTMHLNKESLYLHPLRENQFYQAEVAAHPQLSIAKKVTNQYKSKTIIMKGFGTYNMHECASLFNLKGEQEYILNGEVLSCHTIESETEMKKFSFGKNVSIDTEEEKEDPKTNKSTFLLNENYGFVSIVYNFYDGERLHLKMVKVE